jgi:hypothetical protein
MFITVLFPIAKLWKQPRCPTTDGLGMDQENVAYICIYIYLSINTHTHTHREFYSVIRKNEIMWFKVKWMHLEDIM